MATSSSPYPYSEARREQLRLQIEVPEVNNTILLARYIATAKQLHIQVRPMLLATLPSKA